MIGFVLLETDSVCVRFSFIRNGFICVRFSFYPRAQASRVMYSGWCQYIYICTYVRTLLSSKKIVIERTRDLIYLKFVVTDFFPKIISPSAGENSGDLA